MDLFALSRRPAASITDAEAAAALEILRADDRVASAELAERDNLNRPMINVEMIGLSGIHSLGRVITQISQLNPKPAPYVDPAKARSNAKRNATRAANKAAKDALQHSVSTIKDDSYSIHVSVRARRMENAAENRLSVLRDLSADLRAEFENVKLPAAVWIYFNVWGEGGQPKTLEQTVAHLRESVKEHNRG